MTQALMGVESRATNAINRAWYMQAVLNKENRHYYSFFCMYATPQNHLFTKTTHVKTTLT